MSPGIGGLESDGHQNHGLAADLVGDLAHDDIADELTERVDADDGRDLARRRAHLSSDEGLDRDGDGQAHEVDEDAHCAPAARGVSRSAARRAPMYGRQ